MPKIDLDPAAQAVAHLLDSVTDDQLAGPTPCTQMSVATLLDHLMGLTLAFTWAAGKIRPPADGPAPRPGLAAADNLDPDWRSELPKRLTELVEAWREPSAWTGQAEAGGVTMPAEVAAAVALDEIVLHGWDLARATGQPYTCDPASTAVVLEFVTRAADAEPGQLRDGLFGPPVEVPADASAFDRALGLAGRDPGWSPAAEVVRRLFAAYLAQDRAAAEALVAEDFRFTSPQDDHIDRAAYFERCFPTAERVRRQEIQRLARTGDDVFVLYEYELQTGAVHRNAELLTVRSGRVVEVQVFFGGRY